MDKLKVWVLDFLKRVGGAEPWSTWSALSYFVLGIWVSCAYPSVRSVFVNDALLILFAGTAVFHFEHTGGHDLFDHIGMASALGSIAFYAVGLNWVFVAFGAVGVPLLFVVAHKSGLKLHWLMGICVLGAFAGLWRQHQYGYLIASFVSFLAAYIIHEMPYSSGTAVDKEGRYSLAGDMRHGLGWHDLAALGMFFLLKAGGL